MVKRLGQATLGTGNLQLISMAYLKGAPMCSGRGKSRPVPSLTACFSVSFVLKQPPWESCGSSRLAEQIACFLNTHQLNFSSTG